MNQVMLSACNSYKKDLHLDIWYKVSWEAYCVMCL